MNIETLKTRIVAANEAYRSGTTNDILSDQDYDDMLDALKSQLPENEYFAFLNSLHEVDGKYTHPYVMGSLNKLKAEEPETVFAFLQKYIKSGVLNLSAKIDGISCRLHYEDGKLVGAFTRGNGEAGQNLSDKMPFVKNVPTTIACKDTIDVRGELVIYKNDFVSIATMFKNARNACAGILNQKTVDKHLLSKVSFVAYEIMGGKLTKHDQFIKLKDLTFTTAYWCEYVTKLDKLDMHNIADLLELAMQDFDYETDGLVLSDRDYTSENVYRPSAQVAFKINNLKAVTTIIGIDWRGPSKDGKYVPVAMIKPVDLGGSTISCVTCHNLDYLAEKNIQIGAMVEITKSGDVIPKITRVITDICSGCQPVVRPITCKVCGAELVVDGCDLRCVNSECSDKESFAVANFIRKIGVESAAKKSLVNWNILTFEDLLKFRPQLGSVSENKFYDQLKDKLFSLSASDIFKQLNFHGLSTKSIEKLIDFYGLVNMRNLNFSGGYPDGIGETSLKAFSESAADNFRILDMIMLDSRYNHNVFKPHISRVTVKADKGSVCFTGALNSMTRPVAEAKAISMGWTISSVSKNLTVLVSNDPDSSSGKMKKAKSLGIKIMTEKEFFNN